MHVAWARNTTSRIRRWFAAPSILLRLVLVGLATLSSSSAIAGAVGPFCQVKIDGATSLTSTVDQFGGVNAILTVVPNGGSCSSAIVSAVLVSDSTGGAGTSLTSPTLITSPTGSQPVSILVGPNSSGSASIKFNCDVGCESTTGGGDALATLNIGFALTSLTPSISAFVNSTFNVSVRATNAGAAVPGGTISWSFNSDFPAPGGSTITPSSSVTDASGFATASARITGPGNFVIDGLWDHDNNISTLPLEAYATITINDFHQISVDGNSNSQATINTDVPLAIQLRKNGAAETGECIDFTSAPDGGVFVLAGGGTATTDRRCTDASGIAAAVFRSPTEGTFVVTATYAPSPQIKPSTGVPPISTTANVTIQINRSIALATTGSGNGASGLPGASVNLIVVAKNDGVATGGINVNWSVISGSATLASSSSQSASSSGEASNSLTFGSTAGPIVVRATRADDATKLVDFNLNVVAPLLSKPVSGSGDGAAGAPGTAITLNAFAQNGTAPATVSLDWSVVSGSATLSAATSATDPLTGIATNTATLGSTVGAVVIQAKRSDFPSVTVNYNLTVTQALLAISGAPTSAFTEEATGSGVSATATVNNGAASSPESGVPVTFTIATPTTASFVGGGSSTTLSTNSSGIASSPAINVGRDLSTITVTATAPGRAPVSVNIPVTASVYELNASPSAAISTLAGTPTNLAVTLTRRGAGASSTVVSSGATINWSATPPGGVSLASSSSTAGNGIANNTFTASTPGSYSVTASFNPILAGVSPVSTGFAITVAAVSKTLRKPSSGSGDSQSGLVNSTLPLPLKVIAEDQGAAAAGVVINWSVASGSAQVSNGQSTTNSLGEAIINVTLGASTGVSTITATRADEASATVSFTATANPLQPTLRKPTSGSGDVQSGVVNSVLSLPLKVIAENQGAVAPGVVINWSVASGSAQISGGQSTTNSNGEATINVTLGASAGVSTISATRADAASATVSFSVTANPLLRTLRKPASGSGDGQSGALSSALSLPLKVIAENQGVAASGVVINWAVTSGSAQVSSGQSTTGSTGEATINVTLGASAEVSTITATRSDDASATVSFTATAIAPIVRSLRKPASNSGDGQAGALNTALPLPLTVVAEDSGVAAPGVTINWSASGDVQLGASQSQTNAQGLATMTVVLGATPASFTITASRADASAATTAFVVTAFTPPVNPVLSIENAGASASGGLPGTQITLSSRALSDGTAQADVLVLWQIASGSATLSPAQSRTAANGIATTVVTLGTTPGPVSVSASRSDLGTATILFGLNVTAPAALTLTITGGDTRTGLTGGEGLPLQVLVQRGGTPVEGVRVRWTVESGGARVAASESVSNAVGVATIGLSFGTVAGSSVIVASAETASARFQIATTAPPIGDFTLSIASGQGQRGVTNSAGRPLQVLLLRSGTPVADTPIFWSVASGGARIESSESKTDDTGIASMAVNFGDSVGSSNVIANAGGGLSVGFTLETLAPVGDDALFTAFSGSGQSGVAGTLADAPLVVDFRNGAGPLDGRVISWQVISGDLSLAASNSVTGPDGRADMSFRFGNVPGPSQVRALVEGSLQIVDFSATTTAGTVTVCSNTSAAGIVGQPLAEPLAVCIGTGNAKGLSGATVRWEVVAGGGRLESATSLTDASGRATNRFTLGGAPGTNQVRATLPGNRQLDFAVQGVSGNGVLTIASGDDQEVATSARSAALVVDLKDGLGNAISGARVVWSADNADLDDSTTLTNAQGRTQNVARVRSSGPARVTAAVPTLNSNTVEFNLVASLANTPDLAPELADIGDAIDAFCRALAVNIPEGPEQTDFLARCRELASVAGTDPEAVQTALNQLVSRVGVNLSDAGLSSVQSQFENINSRFDMIRNEQAGGGRNGFNIGFATLDGVLPLSFLPIAASAEEPAAEVGGEFSRWGFFATGTIGRGEVDAKGLRPKLDYDIAGLTAGADYRFNDRWVGGAALGFTDNDSEFVGDRGSVGTRGLSLTAYASWFNENAWYVDSVLSYGRNQYELKRRILYSIRARDGSTTTIDQTATADTDGDQLGASLALGRDYQKGAWSLGAFVKGNFTRVNFDAYEESMIAGQPGEGLALAVDSRSLNSMSSVFGGKAAYVLSRTWGVLIPQVQLEWVHEFRDDPGRVTSRFLFDPTGTRFVQSGSEIDTDIFNLSLGVSALFPGGRSAYLYYEELVGAAERSQSVLSIGGRIEF